MGNDYTDYLLYSLYAGWSGELYWNCFVDFTNVIIVLEININYVKWLVITLS